MDRFDAMSTLLAAVEAGSLSGASRALRMPLATVSRKISDLEAHLGTRLLTRTSRRLELTEPGRAYVEASRRILDDVREAERAAAGEYGAPRGALAVTAPVVFGRLHVLPVATEFLAAYPDIDMRLTLADRIVNLAEDHVDVAVRIGALPDSSLVASRVGDVRRVVCAAPAYLKQRGTPQHPDDLRTHAAIAFDGLTARDGWIFGSGKTEHAVAVRSRLSVNTAEAAIDAANAGLGLARVLSYQAASAVAAGDLAIVLADFEPPAWPVNLVHGGQGLQPLKLRAFLDFAAPRLRARLTQLAV